jgi:hypothetical protein
MLTAYQTALQNLIQAPNSPVPLVAPATQTVYINAARNQLAAAAECIRAPGTLVTITNQVAYAFSAITVPPGGGNGPVITVRSGTINGQPLEIRSWEWMWHYYLGSVATGVPIRVGQQGQGVAGTLYFSPIPNSAYTLSLDVCCLPIPLVDDTTIEAIPELWQDAVPFYAAWLAMQSLQRQADAEMMLRRYQMLAQRGRQTATPTELPDYLPGGRGAAMAAAKTTLAPAPAPPGRGQ